MDGRPRYWVTAIGADQPGIVAVLTRALADAGANIEDASMSRFHGWFAVMLLASAPDGTEDPFAGLQSLADRWDLRLDVRPVAAADPAEGAAPVPTHRISVYGSDRPGIVAAVSQATYERGANILDLEVDVARSPGGADLFVMVMDVAAAPEALEGTEAALGEELGMEVHVVPLEGVIL